MRKRSAQNLIFGLLVLGSLCIAGARNAPAQKPASQDISLRELSDRELYFEAWYRQSMLFDFDAALRAYESLWGRRASPYRRLALIRLLELYRDTGRHDKLILLLKSLRKEPGLSANAKRQLGEWLSDVRKLKAATKEALARYKKLAGRKLGKTELRAARRELLTRLSRGKKGSPLILGSDAFARRLAPYVQSRNPLMAELQGLRARRDKLAAAGKLGTVEGREVVDRLRSLSEMIGTRARSRNPARDLGYLRHTIQRLREKREDWRKQGRRAIVRLYDERIHKQLRELALLWLRRSLRPANRDRALRGISFRVTRAVRLEQKNKDARVPPALLSFERKLRMHVRQGRLSDAARLLLQTADKTPELLEVLLKRN